MVKYSPLLCHPIILEMSGIKVTTTPDEKETNNIIQKTGRIVGSKMSFQPILKSLNENFDFMDFGSVSFMRNKIKIDNKAKIDDIQNISLRPISLAK